MNHDRPKNPSLLHEPEQAIDNYLAALLSEVDEYVPEPEIQKTPETVKPQRVAEIVDFPNKVILPAELPVAPEIDTEPAQTETSIVTDEITKVTEHSADDIAIDKAFSFPEWAEEPFQCLLFKVRGMTLAVPLSELSGIVKWEKEISAIPGQPGWHLGVYIHRDERVVVVDTAKLIMPDRIPSAGVEREKGTHLLLIGEGKWGLACDTLAKPVKLSKEDIRWSQNNTLRPWMAGTVIDKLCILLDVNALFNMVRHG